MICKTVREIAGAWKEYKRPYVKQSTMAAYVLILDLTSSLKKYVFYNCLINNVLYLRIT